MAEYVFGGKNVLFWVIQIATLLILVLAANTAYADFPRLSSIIARDGFLPRQMANRGDRLVFSNGIVFLAGAAAVLIIAFKGNVTALIPLYAFGVFTGFTLSQAGMVVHHFRLREPHWKASAVINGLGAFCTGVVALVVVVSKFSKGAWIPAVLIPLMVVMFKAINRHYRSVRFGRAGRARLQAGTPHAHRGDPRRHRAQGRPSTPSSTPASSPPTGCSRSPSSPGRRNRRSSREAWEQFEIPIPVHTILSPYRELTGPVLDYLDEIDADSPDDVITVIIPEFVTQWKTQWLHNQSAFALKARLLYRPNTVVTSVPVLVGTAPRSEFGREARGCGHPGGHGRRQPIDLQVVLASDAAARTQGVQQPRCSRASSPSVAAAVPFRQNVGQCSSGSRTPSPGRTPISSTCAWATGCARSSTCPPWSPARKAR